jgi:hypothetical protein
MFEKNPVFKPNITRNEDGTSLQKIMLYYLSFSSGFGKNILTLADDHNNR